MSADDSIEPGAAEAGSRDPIAALWSAQTVRARCAQILRAVEDGRSGWFTVQRERLPELAARVARATGRIGAADAPASRSLWGRFAAGGIDRPAALEQRLLGRERLAIARARIDLTVIGVLLDLSPANGWHFEERSGRRTDALALPAERQPREDLLALLERASGAAAAPARGVEAGGGAVSRIEGSAGVSVAVWHAFGDGVFSGDANDPLRVDGRALTRLDGAALRAVFQCAAGQAMPGLDARAELLRRLGTLLEGTSPASGASGRPAALFEPWLGGNGELDAAAMLSNLARSWSAAWVRGGRVLGLPAGDAWPHRWAGTQTGSGADAAQDRPTAGWVPLHLPLQRLVCDLVEPLRRSGLRVVNLEALTAGADADACGLLLDGGVILPREPRDLARTWKIGDEFVVEWRALCVPLFDELARQVRARLGVDARELSMLELLDACRGCERERDWPPLSIDPASALP